MTGAELRELRMGAGVSLRSLAIAARVPLVTLGRMERGESPLTQDVECRTLNALNRVARHKSISLLQAMAAMAEHLQAETTEEPTERASA